MYQCIEYLIWFVATKEKKNMFDRHDFTIMFTTRYIDLPGIFLLIIYIFLEKGYATNEIRKVTKWNYKTLLKVKDESLKVVENMPGE